MRSLRLHAFFLGASGALHLVVALPAHAQRFLDTLPASAYARAERFMQHRASDKMYRNRVGRGPAREHAAAHVAVP